MRDSEGFVRMRTLQCVVLFVFLLIGGRLAYIQLIDSRYNELAKANVLRHVVQYPPRGEVFDRMQNGKYNFNRRNTCFMIDTNRNTTSVINDCYGIIRIDRNINRITISSQCFIYGIVNNLIYQMVQAS